MNLSEPETIRKAIDSVRHQSSPWSVADKQLRNRAASTTDDLDQPTGTHTTMVPTLQTHHHHMRSVSGPCAIENTNNSSDRPLPEESMGHPSNAVVSRGNSVASSAMTDSAVSMPFASTRDAYGVVQHSMFPVLPLASMILQTTQRRHADDSLQKEWHRQSDDASSRPFTSTSASSPRMHSNTFRATPSVAPSPPTSGGDEITKNTLGKLLSGNRSSAQRQRHRTASANTTGAIADVRKGNHHIGSGSGYHQQQRLSAPPTLDVIVGDPEVERLSSAGHSSRLSSTAAGGEGGGVPSPPLSGLGAASVSALAGKDVLLCENMIKILVDEYIAKFGNAVSLESTRQQQAHARGSGGGTAEPPLLHHSGSSDPSMFLASVFSVSPLFESALLARGGCGSSKQLEQRRLSHQAKIAPLHQTRIPEAYWILRDPMHTASIPPTATSLTAKNAFVHLHEGKKTLTFPSTNPSNRPEVYLLAHTLDRLVCDTVHQREALFDAAAAFEIIPEQPSKANEATATEQLQRYTTVVREMYDVIDVGLSELARQTAPTCVERASLLDCIRRLTMDLQGTLLDVVSHCKLRAFSEAKQRQEHDDIIVTKNRQILDARARIAALEEHVLELEREKETNEIKAQRFDVIVSRMELKEQQRQRAIVRADQTEIMSEVDEAVSMSVVEAAHRFDEMLSLASSTGGGAPIESTVAKLERLKREEEQRGNTQMYEECVRLMKTLRQAVEATDAACEPFYQKMLFGSPELNARVSAGRWAAIGKAIGDYEAVYDHRERVAKAHALWLEVVAGHSASASAGTGNSFHQQRGREERSSSLEVPEEATTSTTTPRAAGVPAALLQTVDCTIEHLRAMGVNDVTTEEISMFQNPTFDMDKYLHPTQQLPSRWGLDSVGVGQMLVDVQTTFQEIVLRLNALKKSGLLAEISKPPLMPPARPSDQCSLCGRRDAAEVEKRHQRSLLDNVAKEIAHREEEAMIAVKAMQSERDSWKSQCAELTETIQKLEFRLDMMEHRPLSNTTRSPHPSDTDSPRANANAAFMSHKPSDGDIRGEQQIVVRTSGGGGGAGSSMGVGSSSASRRGSDVRRSPEDSQKQKAGVVRRSSVSKSPIVLDGGSHPSSPNSMQRQRSFSVDGHSSDGSVDKNRKAKGAASSSKSIKEDSTALTSNALSKKASSLHRKGGGGGSSDGLASSSSGVLVRGGGKKSTLHSSKSSANMATTAAAVGGGGVPEEITKGVSPLVIQLVINCSCCNGGKTKKKASDVDGGLELSTEQLAAAVSVTPEGEEAGGGKALPSFSPPRRPNTGGSHRPREVQLASSQSGTLPSMMNSTTLTRRPRTEVGEGEEEEEDKETRGKPIVIPEDEGFAFMAPKLKSFLGSPDPVLAANSSGGGGTAAAPTATTTTRNIRLPSIIASDDESSSSGDDTDHHGHPQSQPPSQPLDSAEGGEGGGMPSIGSSTIVFEHRRRKSSMWESVEDSIMHKLKSIRITKLMSATQLPVDPTTSGTMTTAAQRPTGPRPPANRRASTERKGSATALQHGADAAAAATAAEEETMKRVASAVSVIVSLSEPDRIKQELNKALEVVRQNILRVAGRVENLMSRTCIRPLGWLLRIIDGYYRAKRLSDATAEQDHHPYTPCVRFLFTYLKRQLGAMELVLEHMHYVYLSCDAYMATDMRVMQFLRVLFVYDLRTTTFFLQFSCFTEQCSIGLDFSSSHQHFARDDAIHKQEVLCLRRIAACLTETGLHRRSYAPLLWKTLTHSAVCFPVNDTEWFSSMEKAGMIAESTQRINPKAWSDVDVNLMRFVVHKSAFLSLVCHFEMEDQTRRKNKESK